MNEKWLTEQCAMRPKQVEMLNETTVIQRRNITPYERDGEDGEKETGYLCEYRILSAEEYITMARYEDKENLLVSMEAQAALYEELQEQKENQLTIMGAIAEIYEKLEMEGGEKDA